MPGTNELTVEWFNETTASFRSPLPESDQPDTDACIPDSAGEEDDESDLDQPKAIQPKAAGVAPNSLAKGIFPPSAARAGLVAPRAGPNAGPSRTPLNAVASGSRGVQAGHQLDSPASEASYFSVCWRKPQFKKHKTWDGDAFIMVVRNRVTLISDETGDTMGTSALPGGHMPGEGSELRVGNYDIEVQGSVSYEHFKKATCILNRPTGKGMTGGYTPSSYTKPFKAPLQVKPARNMPGFTPARPVSPVASSSKPRASDSAMRSLSGTIADPPSATVKGVSAASFYSAPKTTKERILIGEKSNKQRLGWGGAMHDPTAEGAVVMQRPPELAATKRNTEIVDVVIDPLLSCRMRDHQKTGVQFMYSSVMGLTDVEAEGCILADEMGLGKTLQTIALIYTMMRQSPFKNDPAGIIGKALIVCPVSLVENWRKEFRKWIGDKLVTVTITDADITKIKAFTHNKAQHVLIIGYERLRKVIKHLASCVPPIGLIVCDEGHRLKSKDNKTSKMFEALRTTRRIILTGTPLQNDLSEFWAMVDFVCPGLLNDYKKFQKYYEKTIYEGRDKKASKEKVALGRERGEELGELSRKFILKRTAAVLNNYLPPKVEYVLFVAPSTLQLNILKEILPEWKEDGRGTGTDSLGMIDLLRKISNSPMLLKTKADELDSHPGDTELESTKNMSRSLIPPGIKLSDTAVSGKLSLMLRLLERFQSIGREKVVIVSNWTGTLDIIGEILKDKRYRFHRLDGSTPSKDRQRLVDSFNRESRDQSFVFLLSSKAGGVGINLIGASRLILFDSDWNPATDAQAMARIHRDGQKMPVYIYRLLTTNTIDEKIYQRQISKIGLADQMMDQRGPGDRDGNRGNAFTRDELKALFSFRQRTDGCKTHDLIQCDCQTKDPAVYDQSSTRDGTPIESDDDDDDLCAKFVSASQYNPDPPKRIQRQNAAEQQKALSALRSWRHFDGLEKTRFEPIADQNLYDILMDAWNERGAEAFLSEDPAGPCQSTDADGGNEAASRSAKRPRTSVSPEKQTGLSALFDSSPSKQSDANSAADDEKLFAPDPTSPPAGSKRKQPTLPARSSVKLVDSRDQGKYDLFKVAGKGGPGRVTFIFEKQSASKMMAEDETEGDGPDA